MKQPILFFAITVFSLLFAACKKEVNLPEADLEHYPKEFYMKGDLYRTDLDSTQSFEFATGVLDSNGRHFEVRYNDDYIGVPYAQTMFTLFDPTQYQQANIVFFGDSITTGVPLWTSWTKEKVEAYFTPGKIIPLGEAPNHATVYVYHPFALGRHIGIYSNAFGEEWFIKLEEVEDYYYDSNFFDLDLKGKKIRVTFRASIPKLHYLVENGEGVIFIPYED